MIAKNYAIILVNSANHALKAERVLENMGVFCKLIPVPRNLSSDCGICIRVIIGDMEKAVQALELSRIPIAGSHKI